MECDKKNCPLAELTTTAVTSARAHKLDHLEFIFQQRMSLFNTRRDHEWKIFFGVVFLLGAVDYGLLNLPAVQYQKVQPYAELWWPACVAVLFLVSVAYQRGVQSRNHADRCVMDAILKEICADLPIGDARHRKTISSDVDCSVTQKTYSDAFHLTYLWAFWCEVVVLLVACIVSAMIPYLF